MVTFSVSASAQGEIEVFFSNPVGTDEVRLSLYDIDLRNIKSIQELNVLGESVKDADIETIDVVVVRRRSLPRQTEMEPLGRAAGDGSSYPGLQNTMIIVEPAADEDDRYPLVAGHEAGHILLDREFPRNDPNDPGHSLDAENLMFKSTDEVETTHAHKRLTLYQQIDARDDSGPGGSGPLLLKQLSKREE